jgi:hypothetical protein
MPSSYVSGRVMSDQTEHSRAIIVGYVPSGHLFRPSWRMLVSTLPAWPTCGLCTSTVLRKCCW